MPRQRRERHQVAGSRDATLGESHQPQNDISNTANVEDDISVPHPPASLQSDQARNSPPEPQDLQAILNQLKKEKQKRETIQIAVANYTKNASPNDEFSKRLKIVEAEEEKLLREIVQLKKENFVQEFEIMAGYRQKALEKAPAIRYNKRHEQLLVKQFEKSQIRDIRTQEAVLSNLRRQTEAALHVLTRLPLLMTELPPETKEEASHLIKGVTELDDVSIKPLLAAFEALRY